MSNPAIWPLGPCNVKFNGVDMGNSEGGVTLKDELKKVDLHYDGVGDGPVGAVTAGRTVTVEAKFADQTYAQLVALIEGAAGTSNVVVSNSVGVSLYEKAQQLILTRLISNVPSTDPNDVITVNKAYPIAKTSLPFDNKTQHIVDVTFECYPSRVTGHRGEFYTIGPS